jgi:integrase
MLQAVLQNSPQKTRGKNIMAGKVRYLLERNGHYWTRIAVPLELRPIIGKRELLEALGDSREAALRRHPAAIARLMSVLDTARSRVATGKARPAHILAGRQMTMQEMARIYYDEALEFDDAIRNSGHPAATIGFVDENRVRTLRSVVTGAASDEEMHATVGLIINTFRKRGSLDVDPATPEWRSVARAFAAIELEALSRTAERDEGDFNGRPTHPLLTEPAPKPTPAPDDKLGVRIISDDSTKTLAELLPRFLAERGASGANQSEHHVSVRMFQEFLGEPTPVYKVTRSHLNGYKTALMQTPSNYVKRFPGMTLPQAIEANQKRASPFPKLHSRTVAKWLARLHALLNWCVQNDVIPDNSAAGVKIRFKEDSGKASRSDFSPGDLSKIFAPPMFDPSKPFGEDQWAMLISIFSGTRPSELAQIKLDSIRRVRGVLVFQVEEETKNRGSQRMIPVHKALLDLGLEQRIAELRKAGETNLFPVWYQQGQHARKLAEDGAEREGRAVTINQHYPKYLPKRINVTYLPSINVKAKGKDFYSFRHCFKTGLSLAGVSKDIRDYLTGHHDKSPGSVYEHDVSIEAMKEAIDRLSFDGVDLKALTPA